MILYGEIFDSIPKHSDNILKFWLEYENHDVFVKFSSWSKFNFLFYFSVLSIILYFYNIFNIFWIPIFNIIFKIWSTRIVRTDSIIFISFSELKYIIYILSYRDLKIYLIFWLKVIGSTIIIISLRKEKKKQSLKIIYFKVNNIF